MIQACTITDAYNQLNKVCRSVGYKQKIDRGSFEDTDTYRIQLEGVMAKISDPLNFLDLPKEFPYGVIEKYYNEYIIGDSINKNEEYTYAERILKQLPEVLQMLNDTPNTNQASIAISQPSDIYLKNPPCLREIGVKVAKDRLFLTSYWRSNDIEAAFITNQGGMALLGKDIADYIGIKTVILYYYSDGAHIYKY